MELYNNTGAMYADMGTDNGNLWNELFGMARMIYSVAPMMRTAFPNNVWGRS